MLFSSNIVLGQGAIPNGTGYSGWLFHYNHLTIGGDFEPKSTLHLHHATNPIGPINAPTTLQFTNVSTGYSDNNQGLLIGLLDGGSVGAVIKQQEYGDLSFYTNNIYRMKIDKDGLIGIGVSTPTANFDVNGTLKFRTGANINYILTSDAVGNANWDTLKLSLANDIIKINNFSPLDLSAYKQTLSISNDTLRISNGNSLSLQNYLDNTDNQALSLTNNKLSITNSSDSVDLSNYLPLTETEVDNFVSNNGYLTSEADADSTNELQLLTVNGGQLEISNGNSIPISSLGTNIWQQNSNNDAYYNTGKVGIGLTTPASNLHLHNTQASTFNKAVPSGGGNQEDDPPVSQHVTTTFQLTNTNTGEEESDGLVIQSSDYDAIFNLQESGNMSFFSNNNTGLYLKNNGNVGVGTTTPQSCLHIHNSTPASGGGGGAGSQTGKSGEGIVTIQLTNAITGTSENDGLFISAKQNDAIINLNETGSFDIKLKDQSAFKIYENKDVQIPSLSGSGFRVLVADFSGKLKIADENMEFDNLGNHTATQNLDMNDNSINNARSITVKREHGNWVTLKTDNNTFWSFHNHYSDNKLRFSYNNTDYNVLVLDGNTSNVGIGTSSPTEKLTLEGESPNIKISNSDETEAGIIFTDKQAESNQFAKIMFNSENNNINFYVNNSTDSKMIIKANGFVGIGTDNPTQALTVKGKIVSQENIVVVDVNNYNYPDYVFEDDYNPISLDELEKFITKNNHLPEIPTTADVAKEGIKLGEMNIKLLKKVEELTLYTIEQEKAINEQKELYKKQQELIELLLKRIEKIEEDK